MLQRLTTHLSSIDNYFKEPLQLKIEEIKTSTHKPLILNMYLFGSVARGTPKALSDIDILLEVSNDATAKERLSIISDFVDDVTDPNIDIVTISTNHLHNGNTSFIKGVSEDMLLIDI